MTTRRYEDPRNAARRGPDLEQKIALSRLSSELRTRANYGLESSRDLYLSSLRTLSDIRGTSNADVRLNCLLDCVRFFFLQGRVAEALQSAHQIELLARKTRNSFWLRRAENAFGMVYAEDGRVGEAVVHYSRALEYAQNIDDLAGEVTVLINLGVALNYGSLYREAIPCLSKARLLSNGALDSDKYEAAALCNLAQSYLSLDEPAAGYEAILKSLQLSREPTAADSAFQRTVRELTCVQLTLDLKMIAEARAHSSACQLYARRADTPKAHFLASLATGMIEIHAGDVDSGLEILRSALAHPVSDLNMFRADALVALVKSYDEANRPEEALSYLKELMSYVKQSRAAGLFALRSMPSSGISNEETQSADLRSLGFREAKLKAQVAERRLSEANREMLERLAVAADLREDSSGQHGYRVGALAGLVAKSLGWDNNSVRVLEMAARLHDIGKTGIPDRILLCTETLKEVERQFVCAHTTIGSELLAKSDSLEMKVAEEVAHFHHEWWNGEGYPLRLQGKRIPMSARIVALADVFDALTHGRPYAEAWPEERALREIRGRAGVQFDPQVTLLFVDLVEKLLREHNDLDEYLGRASKGSPVLQAREKIRSLLAIERQKEREHGTVGSEGLRPECFEV